MGSHPTTPTSTPASSPAPRQVLTAGVPPWCSGAATLCLDPAPGTSEDTGARPLPFSGSVPTACRCLSPGMSLPQGSSPTAQVVILKFADIKAVLPLDGAVLPQLLTYNER